MIANQTLVAPDGKEVALFPMPYMNMSQDEGGDYSHDGTYNIDFLGWDANGRVYNAPIYAPCTMMLITYLSSYAWGNLQIFESVDKVHLPNGALDYLCIMFAHDNNPPITTTGTTVNQGQLCYHTGTYGDVTGDHVHSCVGQGYNEGLVRRSTGNYDLANRIHYWDGVYVNDTTIINGYGHNWQTYTPQPTPTRTLVKSQHKFPWAIYARKLRENR